MNVWNRLGNRSLPYDRTLDIERVRVAGEAFDSLWERCADERPVSVIRDRAWVAWRFLAPPEADYHLFLATRGEQPAGYIATRLAVADGVRRGIIAEWLAPDDDAAARRALLRQAIDHFIEAGAQSVTTLAVPGTDDQRLLRRAGFLGGAAFTVRLAPFDPGLPMPLLRDRRQWRIGGSDFDVV